MPVLLLRRVLRHAFFCIAFHCRIVTLCIAAVYVDQSSP